MPDAYELYDGKFVQTIQAVSAANALTILTTRAVPDGKIWTILGANYEPSAAETKVVAWGVYTRNAQVYPITIPQSFQYLPTLGLGFPCVREGMEIKLLPGDYLFAARDSATAGSTMAILVRFVETDMPLLRYVEPQREVPQRRVAHSTIFSASPGAAGRAGLISEPGPGGGKRSEPK